VCEGVLRTEEVDVSDPQLDVMVRAAVARQLRLPPDNLTGDLDLRNDLGVGQDEELALLSAMGEALDVSFPDDFLDGVHTYADLTTAVKVSLGP
jgi:acyl carrier protein